jgi:hypothetical protein
MLEQLADHRQPFADEQSTGRERMAKIMDAYVSEVCRLADASPRMLKVGQVRLLFLSHDNVWVAGHANRLAVARFLDIAKALGVRHETLWRKIDRKDPKSRG